MPVKLTAALIAATLLVVAGCQRSEDRFLEREVASEELVGTWVLRLESVQDLESIGIQIGDGRASHRLELPQTVGVSFEPSCRPTSS